MGRALLFVFVLALIAACNDGKVDSSPDGASSGPVNPPSPSPSPSPSPPTGSCGASLAAQDLAGNCGSAPTTPGAVEAVN